MNRETFEKYIEIWNNKNYEELSSIAAPDLRRDVPETVNQSTTDVAGLIEVMKHFHTAFPDSRVEIKEVHYFEDKSFGAWTFTGTNTGPGDMPPTGRKVEVDGLSLMRYEDGKMVAEEIKYDVLEFMMQLGVIEMPESAAAA